MQIALMVEGQTGLTWERWKALVARVEDWGFAGLYRSDHFTMGSPPNEDSLEMIVSLAYAAEHLKQIPFGPLVAPFSFRDPVMLARQAAHLDALSNGRMILGVGAGWMEREHEMFGYPLLDTRARLERFTEGVQVVHHLLKSDAPVTYEGRWYTLREAEILPRPFKTKILVGGSGIKHTLKLAARYADVWNGVALTPAAFRERAKILDDYLYDAGRETNAVKKTTSSFFLYGHDADALERSVAPLLRHVAEWREMPRAELYALGKSEYGAITGVGDQVIPQLEQFAEAGVQEMMLQIFNPSELESLDDFAARVIPRFV